MCNCNIPQIILQIEDEILQEVKEYSYLEQIIKLEKLSLNEIRWYITISKKVSSKT